MPNSRHVRRVLILPAQSVLGLLLTVVPSFVGAATPDSPEVKQMIERALKSLETGGEDERLGARCLAGLSFFKAGRTRSHPKIAAAQRACETSIANAATLDNSSANYSLGLALIFLLETDPDRNQSLARRYVGEILRRQQRWGSWGYENSETGDTSQTQYTTI